MRFRYLLALLLVSTAAFAYTPEELLTRREVAFKCDKGVCQVAEQDLDWMVSRDQLLSVMVQKVYERLQQCRGEKST